ncbi:hypothetical protein OXT66_07510 [Lentilactobacillus senioris]|uniref:hypothetical protein n=1 Tax=Lentilactobacillus senioris TaxID=931534 RepID=UPI002280ABCF|nr:hypothetical protein [Lentilactobacillus senioris]MCY9807379.1 hypothetical protein [Lentilactobacillus senioris]
MTKPNSSFKNIALLLTVASGLAFSVATPQTVNAASYHNGVPKVLRGKWRSGIKTYKYGKIIRKSRAHAHFYKKSFSNQGAFYPDPN